MKTYFACVIFITSTSPKKLELGIVDYICVVETLHSCVPICVLCLCATMCAMVLSIYAFNFLL
jgi:hypothetical protein